MKKATSCSGRATSSTTSRGRRSASISIISSRAACRRTSRRSSSATTVRVHELGAANRAPTPAELERMRDLVRPRDGGGRAGRRRPRSSTRRRRSRRPTELIELAQSRRAGRGHVHLAHAQRGQPSARGGRRGDHDRAARRRSAPRSITSRRRAQTNWPQARCRDREDRGGARGVGSRSPPTCTPTPPVRPGSMPRCRRGCRKAATMPGRRG